MYLIQNNDYFKIQKNGISLFQNIICYLGGSIFQVFCDNPITTYRQFLQQNIKDNTGKLIDPRISVINTNQIFLKYPLSFIFSGLKPRLIGVFLKSIPKFTFMVGISSLMGEKEDLKILPAIIASLLSAPLINPIRMIEKQQRKNLKYTGKQKNIYDIIKESSAKKYQPLFRGTSTLMCHSVVSSGLGLVGQPEIKKYIEKNLIEKKISSFQSNLIASSCITPIYVILTNPISRIEVLMHTNNIENKPIKFSEAVKDLIQDKKLFGLRGIARGQGIGIIKGIYSLTMFHESRIFLENFFINYNLS